MFQCATGLQTIYNCIKTTKVKIKYYTYYGSNYVNDDNNTHCTVTLPSTYNAVLMHADKMRDFTKKLPGQISEIKYGLENI